MTPSHDDSNEELNPGFRAPGDRRPANSEAPLKKRPVVLRRPAGTFKPYVPPTPEEAFPFEFRKPPAPRPPLVTGDARYLTFDEKGRLRTVTCYRAPNFKEPVIQRPGKKKN